MDEARTGRRRGVVAVALLVVLAAPVVPAPSTGAPSGGRKASGGARDLASEALDWVRRGHELLRARRAKDACECFAHAALLLPTWWIPHFERASCGRVIGDPYDVLVRHAEAAATHAPANGVAWELLGFVHEDAGFADRARVAYERALTLDGRLRRARLRLAGLDLAAGRHGDARERFAAVLEEWPTDTRALNGLAEAALALDAYHVAERALLTLAVRSNYPPRVYARLVALYREAGDTSGARAAERAWHRAAAGRTVTPALSPRLRAPDDRAR